MTAMEPRFSGSVTATLTGPELMVLNAGQEISLTGSGTLVLEGGVEEDVGWEQGLARISHALAEAAAARRPRIHIYPKSLDHNITQASVFPP